MKILFFIDALFAGGKERRLTELLKSLRNQKGIEFELVVMNKDVHYKEVLDLNINIHYLIRKTKKDFSIFSKFYKICKNYRPDIVHCWDGMTAVYSVPACKILNIKLVNGMVVDTPVKRNLSNKHWLRGQLTFPFSSMVIGNSNAGLEAYDSPKKRSICIYNGMDLSRFTNLKELTQVREEVLMDKNDSSFIIGMVAAFEERKDYTTLIKAALRLIAAHQNIKFLFIGDGANLKEMKKLVPLESEGNIIFLGKRTEVESIINLFDIGILLTNSKVHGEGISNSIIEYMALNKPVIATEGGGTNEVVMDAINGFIIEPDSEVQLIDKIEQLLSDPEKRSELGKAGKKMIAEKFDVKIMVHNYLRTYQKLLKE